MPIRARLRIQSPAVTEFLARDFDAANGVAGLLTRVPGGVGVLTVTMLLRNTLRAYELQNPS